MSQLSEMHFYESKMKLVLVAIGALILAAFLFIASVVIFNKNHTIVGILFLLGGLFFSFCLVIIMKKVRNKSPYVTLTDSHLTLYISPKSPIHIKWMDIQDYTFYKIYLNIFIGLGLKDEKKYREQMTPYMKRLSQMNVKMGYPQFNIVWGQLKNRDRLLEELYKRNPNIMEKKSHS